MHSPSLPENRGPNLDFQGKFLSRSPFRHRCGKLAYVAFQEMFLHGLCFDRSRYLLDSFPSKVQTFAFRNAKAKPVFDQWVEGEPQYFQSLRLL
jgi:hypothetical protein